MTETEFRNLIDQAHKMEMTPTDCETQRRSFAFGNANIENASVTRELIDEIASKNPLDPKLCAAALASATSDKRKK